MKLNCPQCNKEMIYKTNTKYESFYHTEDEEEYYQLIMHERYSCKECKINLIDNEWKIPKQLLPTEKQINVVKIICDNLDMEYIISTKKDAIKFIGEYLNTSITVSRERSNYQSTFDYLDESECF